VARFDRVQCIILHRDEMLAAIVDQLPFAPDQAIRIVDVGAGFGALTEIIFHRFPHAVVTWVDLSEEMYREAMRRLAPYAGSITYHLRDFNTINWSQGFGDSFDAVVSSLSLHHATDVKRVYADVYRLLKSGGCFVNGDVVRAPVEWLEARNHRQRAMLTTQLIKQHFHKEKTVDEVIAIDSELAECEGDNPQPLEAHLQWLHDAGFRVVDCAWKHDHMAITIAYNTP
jgi:tRNA (cmo5U34)-methyltransferase